MTPLKKAFQKFKQEAELFFVSKFVTSESIEKEYSDCLDIMFNITKTKDPTKGLILFNKNYGQGKSFFFDVVNHRVKRIEGSNIFRRTTAKDLVAIYTGASSNEDPQKKLDEFIRVKNLFIDDIGDEGEKKIFKHYSNELNVIRYVLLKRYEFWVEKEWKTFATTNLTLEEIALNYDGRCADRLLQMTYWKEFKFLKSGSFRQMEQTRRLTQVEINENWKKFEPQTETEKVDLDQYFNELINEKDEYFIENDFMFWELVMTFLLDKNILTEKDFESISYEELKVAEFDLRSDIRETKLKQFHLADHDTRRFQINQALNRIKNDDILKIAKTKIARKKFMELRTLKYKF